MEQENSLKPIALGELKMADMDFVANSNADSIWNFLMSFVSNPKGVAGLMGNLYYESQCYPYKVYGDNSVPPSSRSRIYTAHYDNHDAGYDMNAFISDSTPYGLAQWLTSTRKQGLYEGKAHNSSTIRYPSTSYSIGSLSRGMDFIKYELLDISYYNVDYNTMVNATDEQAAALSLVIHYEGISTDDGSFSTRQKLAHQIYLHYTGTSQNTIYINVTGNGISYVSNYHPADQDNFTLYAIPNGSDTLNSITATTSTGASIAMQQATEWQYTYNESAWGNFITINVIFSGSTPPSPPTPTPRDSKYGKMPIWFYPVLRRF